MTKYTPEDIWYNNPKKLLENPFDLFPLNYTNKSIEEKINSFIKMSIAASILLFILNPKMFMRMMIIFIILVIFLVVYYENLVSNNSITILEPKNEKEINIRKQIEKLPETAIVNNNTKISLSPIENKNINDDIIKDIQSRFKFNQMVDKNYAYFKYQIKKDRNTNYILSS